MGIARFSSANRKGGTNEEVDPVRRYRLPVFCCWPWPFSQSRETGAIAGTVTDQQGAALPGVSVTVTGPNLMGTRTVVTDGRRAPTGSRRCRRETYSVKAELPGFKTVVQEDIRLTTTTRLTVDIDPWSSRPSRKR